MIIKVLRESYSITLSQSLKKQYHDDELMIASILRMKLLSGGWTCLEAMAAGRPVVCLDLGGPATQVTEETGIKVPAPVPNQAVSGLAEAMTRLARDSEQSAFILK